MWLPLLATRSVQTAAISIHQKVNFVSQVQTDRTLVPRVGGSIPTPRLLQFNITLVNPPSDRNCLIVPCISKLEDLHSHNVFLLGITMTMRDGLTSISSLLNPFYYPYQPMHCFLFSNHFSLYAHIHDSLSN